MQDIRDIIKSNKRLYKDMLSEKAFNLLFSSKKLTIQQLITMNELISTTIISNIPHYTNMDAKGIRTNLFDSLSTRIISSIPVSNEYIKIIATANNIYAISNTTKQLTSCIDIMFVHEVLFVDAGIVILSNHNVIKHIGMGKDKLEWYEESMILSSNIGIHCNLPSDKLNEKTISYIVLNNMR